MLTANAMTNPAEQERAAVVAEYMDAYEAANGYRMKDPPRYERGWWHIKFSQKVRTAQLVEYAARLRERVAARLDGGEG